MKKSPLPPLALLVAASLPAFAVRPAASAQDGQGLADVLGELGFDAEGNELAQEEGPDGGTLFEALQEQDPEAMLDTTPVLTVQAGHSTAIGTTVFTPDGRYLITAAAQTLNRTSDQYPLVWEAESGRELKRLLAYHPNSVSAMAVSSDGQWVITGGWGAEVFLTHVDSGWVYPSSPGSSSVHAVGIAPDQQSYVVACDDGMVYRYAWSDGSLLTSVHVGELVYSDRMFALTDDTNHVLSASPEGVVKVHDLTTGGLWGELFVGETEFSVAVAGDASWAAAGTASGKVLLWEPPNPEPIAMLEVGVSAMTFHVSEDGSHVAVLDEEGVYSSVWRFEGAEEMGQVPGSPMGFTPDSRMLLTTPYSENSEVGNNTVRLYDLEDGTEVARYKGLVSPLTCVATHPDFPFVVTGDIDGMLTFWDRAEGAVFAKLPCPQRINEIGFSEDGRFLYASMETFDTSLWGSTGAEADGLFGPDSGFDLQEPQTFVWTAEELPFGILAGPSAADEFLVGVFEGRVAELLPDGRLATGDREGTVRVWDLEQGQIVSELPSVGQPIQSLSYDQGSGRLAVGQDTAWEEHPGQELVVPVGMTRILDLATGEPAGPDLQGRFAEWSADGSKLVVSSGRVDALMSGDQEGCFVSVFSTDTWEGASVFGRRGVLTPDGRSLVTGYNGWIDFSDAATGEGQVRVPGHGNQITGFALSADGQFVWSSSLDGALILTDLEDRVATARAVSFFDRELLGEIPLDALGWATQDGEGRFDAAYGGDVEGLHWTNGTEVIYLFQLKDDYYEPGLLARLLLGEAEALRTVTNITTGGELGSAPTVDVSRLPDDSSRTLEFTVTDSGSGIGKVSIFVNGREYREDARGSAQPQGGKLALSVDLTDCLHFIEGGENAIEIVPHAESGLRGRGGRVRTKRTTASADAPQRLFAIVAGVSAYAGEDIRLLYAARDAIDFAKTMESAAKELYGADKVTFKRLHDEGTPATRENLLAAMQELESTKTSDTVLLYLAGHGVSVDDEYYYLTKEATSLELPDGEDARKQVAISGSELAAWLNDRLRALKVVIILDTCSSGQLISDLAQSRGGDGSRRRAMDALKSSTSAFLLAGSAADKPSYEATPYGKGLLTYSLLKGMQGAAVQADEQIDVGALLSYAQREVPALAKDLKGVQKPILHMPRREARGDGEQVNGRSFPIGLMRKEIREEIDLPTKRPYVMTSGFKLNPGAIDKLDLTDKIKAAMRDYTYSNADARFAFLESSLIPGSYEVTGTYSEDGDAVTLDLFIYKDKKAVVEGAIQLKGSAQDLDRMVKDVIARVANAVEEKP